MLGTKLIEALRERNRSDLYRTRCPLATAQGVEVLSEGKAYLSFASNDYLGLANHPEIVNAFKRGLEKYGVGSGSSAMVSGFTQAHLALEEELAAFTQCERAMVFTSGYQANLAVLSTLLDQHDHVFADRLSHASIYDAAKLSGAQFHRFHHADPEHLHSKLSSVRTGHKIIATDGVFSVHGDIAPLPALIQCATQADAWLMLDDSHGIGVLGTKGRGLLEHFHLTQNEVPILVGGFGKAVGCQGAFVAGSRVLIEALIQFARPYMYTTALAPAMCSAIRVSLRLLQKGTWRREKLHALVEQFRHGAAQLDIPLMPSETPIQLIPVANATQGVAYYNALREQGIWVGLMREPSVPPGETRLRISFSALHTENQIARLLKTLSQIMKNVEVPLSEHEH